MRNNIRVKAHNFNADPELIPEAHGQIPQHPRKQIGCMMKANGFSRHSPVGEHCELTQSSAKGGEGDSHSPSVEQAAAAAPQWPTPD